MPFYRLISLQDSSNRAILTSAKQLADKRLQYG